MPPRVPILDTMVLQAYVCGHPLGADILLASLGTSAVRFPAEVYNEDEGPAELAMDDPAQSEFARGIRSARNSMRNGPLAKATQCKKWLDNFRQLPPHLKGGTYFVDPLQVSELPNREALMKRFGIGRGEAAGLVLAQRAGDTTICVSSDARACEVAQSLGLPYRTIPGLVEDWVRRSQPSHEELQRLLTGMANARFALKPENADFLHSLIP